MFNKQIALEAIGTIIELKNGVKKAREIAQNKLQSFRSVYGEFTGESLGQFQFVDSNLNPSFPVSIKPSIGNGSHYYYYWLTFIEQLLCTVAYSLTICNSTKSPQEDNA